MAVHAEFLIHTNKLSHEGRMIRMIGVFILIAREIILMTRMIANMQTHIERKQNNDAACSHAPQVHKA